MICRRLHRGHFHHSQDRRFARGGHGLDPHHPGFGRHGRGGGRSAGGRLFGHGDLRLVVLQLIAEKPRHGYEIIKAVEERAGGAYSPSPGVIYPTLTFLEELGHARTSGAEESGGAKRLYEATEEGRAFLEANRQTTEALFARMEEAARIHGGGPAPQILRAMENLKLALRLRLSRGPLSEEQVNAIAATLDAAATSVERI